MAKSSILKEYKGYDQIIEYSSWKSLENSENIKYQWAKWTTFKGYNLAAVINHLKRVNKKFKLNILSVKKVGKKRIAKIKFVR